MKKRYSTILIVLLALLLLYVGGYGLLRIGGVFIRRNQWNGGVMAFRTYPVAPSNETTRGPIGRFLYPLFLPLCYLEEFAWNTVTGAGPHDGQEYHYGVTPSPDSTH
jgi:hypothetical protein